MCGICGILSLNGAPAGSAKVPLMMKALAHRGPDDEGMFSSGPAALGFKRLSILDLERGHQPMVSSDGSVAVVFNGEIYNHLELRRELQAGGETFNTHSDTETLLKMYMRYGIEAVKRLEGMFAFAVWDAKKQELFLARDVFGIKPLYYSVNGDRVVFASELRALLKSGISPEFDADGVCDYLRFGFVPAPYTVLKNIHKLPAAHYISFKPSAGNKDPLALRRYYKFNVSDDALRGKSQEELIDQLDVILNESVKAHLLSDVPVGSFLSGGLDSSLITALMCKHASGRVQTFSIGFMGGSAGLDESKHAMKVAKYLGTEHEEIMLPKDVLKDIPGAMLGMDEPIGDSAILPTYLLAKHARKHVKVALSGEGADELFAGYGRYKTAYISYRIMKNCPYLKNAAKAFYRRMGRNDIARSIPFADSHEWLMASVHSNPSRISKMRNQSMPGGFQEGDARVLGYADKNTGFNGVLLADLQTIMADCLIMKVDKTTMAASLESRVPFLSRPVAEFALNLPPETKVRRFKSKWILRQLARKYIPADIASRSKHGFWVDWEGWICSNPKEVQDAFAGNGFTDEGIFDSQHLQRTLREINENRKGADTGLMFRTAILAVWRRSLN